MNAFPLFFIDKYVEKCCNKLFVKRNKPQKRNCLFPSRFLGKVSLHVKKHLSEIFRTYQKNIKLKVVFKSSNRLKNNFRFKDKLPK